MKTIKNLKVNGEEAGIKVTIHDGGGTDSPGLTIDSNSFRKGGGDILYLRPAETDGVFAGYPGGVKLKKNVEGDKLTYMQTDDNGYLCLPFNSRHFGNKESGLILKTYREEQTINNIIPLIIGSSLNGLDWHGPGITFKKDGGIGCTKQGEIYVDPEQIKGATQVTWDANSNMNNFTTPGVYEIYGERTRQDDNLPILNASSGHSIAARLIVVASTLQPANNEICITQFLMLSNRQGGDGNMYIRTYNENNSPFADWWTPWQKMQGVKEGYIFTNTAQINPDGGVQEIVGVTGLDNMIDNGIYTGIYTDDPTFQTPTFIDTFTLIVINNYAVAGKDERLKRTISQLKYAVDAITNQATVKLRTKTDGDTAWSDWTEIGGGSNEVDITDAVKAYGLPTLVAQGLAKEGVNYVINASSLADLQGILDTSNKIYSKLDSVRGGMDSSYKLFLKIIGGRIVIDVYEDNNNNEISYINYYKFIMGKGCDVVKVSADMTTL